MQVAVHGLFRGDHELDRTELCNRARHLPGWSTATGQKLGKTFGVLSMLGVLVREDRSSAVRIYRPGSVPSLDLAKEQTEDSETPALTDVPLPTEEPRLTGLQFGDWDEQPKVVSEAAADQSPEEASVTADYGSTFAVLWIACPSGEFIPAHLDFGNLGFADRSGLNQFIEEMVFREHAVPVSIKRGVSKFGGCKLTQKGKEYLVQFRDPSLPPANSPPTVAVVEPTEPPRSELKLPTSPTEQNTLITELQRQLEELKQSLVAAQAARIIDALRGQPTSIAQACLIEAGRQLGLDLVPRPLV